jgi:hypothetical protein
MNIREARRAMLKSGKYNPQEISNLASFGTTYGKGEEYFKNIIPPFTSSFQIPAFDLSEAINSSGYFVDPSLQFQK